MSKYQITQFVMEYVDAETGELEEAFFHSVPKYASGVVSYPWEGEKRITYRHPVPLTRRGAVGLMRKMLEA